MHGYIRVIYTDIRVNTKTNEGKIPMPQGDKNTARKLYDYNVSKQFMFLFFN